MKIWGKRAAKGFPQKTPQGQGTGKARGSASPCGSGGPWAGRGAWPVTAHVRALGRFVDKVLPKNERLASVRALLVPPPTKQPEVTSTRPQRVSNVWASTGLNEMKRRGTRKSLPAKPLWYAPVSEGEG